MKWTILRKMRYESTFIYIIQFGFQFQYLISWDGEITQDMITVKPHLWQRFLYYAHIKPKYTRQQLEEAEEIMLCGAMTTIDYLKREGRSGKKRRAKQIEKVEKRTKDCTWQAREGGKDREMFYVCITHGEAVKMIEGVRPKHN